VRVLALVRVQAPVPEQESLPAGLVQVLVLVLASELPAFASESWKAWCN
jgi:hypothetical protein